MTKEELRELATWGVRKRLQDIEQQLAVYHAEFPELFVSETKPVLLRAEPREDGKEWGLTPKPPPKGAPQPSTTDRVLAFLADSPPTTAGAIALALGIADSQVVRTALYRLQQQERVTRNAATGEWLARALRDKYLALPPSPSEPVDTRTHERRVLDFLATNPTPMGMTGTMRACGLPPSSTALYKLRKQGKVKQAADGTWSLAKRAHRKASAPASAPAGTANDSQPALPLAPQPRANRVHPTRYWKEQWYVRLQTHGKAERIGESAIALGSDSGTLATSAQSWLKAGIIEKVGAGIYQVGKVQPAPGVLLAASQALASRNGAHA